MTLDQRLRSANPVPNPTDPPSGAWSADVALLEIERRSDSVETIERTTTEPTGPGRNRGWLLAAAVAALVVLIGAIVIGLQHGTDVVEPTPTTLSAPPTTTAQPAIDRSPLEVLALHDEAFAAGDWTAMRALYATTADYEMVAPDLSSLPRFPLTEGQGTAASDWDGDGLLDGYDEVLSYAAWVYAHGASTFLSCAAVDATTVSCEEVWDGHAFDSPSRDPNTRVFTVVDGYITTEVLEVASSDFPIDTGRVSLYRVWVRDNTSEPVGELFQGEFNLAIDPVSVVTHRRLVPEWLANGITERQPEILEATVTWDGARCSFDGQTFAAPGDNLNITFQNNSGDTGGFSVDYLVGDASIADLEDHVGAAMASDYEEPSFIVFVGPEGDVAVPAGESEAFSFVLEAPAIHTFTCFGPSTSDPRPADASGIGLAVNQ